MKSHLSPGLLGLAFLFLSVLPACQSEPASEAGDDAAAAAPTHADTVRHGEYLVSIMGCNDCHTPKTMTDQGPVPDMSRMLSGHPADAPVPAANKEALKDWVLFSPDLTTAIGPWGTTFSANLTPHETGLGNWTEEHFFRALREGKHKGLETGRPIMPPMPWQALAPVTDDDLRAIFAYLKSIPPINNLVPDYIPPTPM